MKTCDENEASYNLVDLILLDLNSFHTIPIRLFSFRLFSFFVYSHHDNIYDKLIV